MEVLLFPNGTGSQWCSVENPYGFVDANNLEENGETADYHFPYFGEAETNDDSFLGFTRYLHMWRDTFTSDVSTF